MNIKFLKISKNLMRKITKNIKYFSINKVIIMIFSVLFLNLLNVDGVAYFVISKTEIVQNKAVLYKIRVHQISHPL